MKPTIWITKDGRVLNIKDMSTNHIKNCIKYLEDHPEFFAHGVDAIDMFDGYYEPNTEEWMAHIEAFQEELDKRN